jgi:hypothetical protein
LIGTADVLTKCPDKNEINPNLKQTNKINCIKDIAFLKFGFDDNCPVLSSNQKRFSNASEKPEKLKIKNSSTSHIRNS